jgi:16S rRNA (adenine1518-N6/adenine1519-N6)-dimethyltransferase
LTLSRRQVSELLTRHGLRPSRALGQNFVADPNTVRRIARLAGVGPGDHVIEIGPGLGSLTLALAETGADVLAVEADRHLIPVLEEVVGGAGSSVHVVHADAMHLDWPSVLSGAERWVLVANLPYNIATPLIADLLDSVPQVERMLVMVQAEMGERLAARAGNDAYGAVSVKVAYWANASVVGRVPASVFVPRPKVESVLVDIRRRPRPAVDPAVVEASLLFALVRAGFAQRRKMLRRALAGLVTADVFEIACIAPEARAEELSVEDWGRLAAAAAPEGDSPGG